MTEARKEATQDLREALEQEQKAAEGRGEGIERQKVAGTVREVDFREKLADDLGNGWLLEKAGTSWVATRKTASRAGGDFMKKVDDKIKDLRNDEAGLTVTHRNDEVALGGHARDCANVRKAVVELAGIDGVNRIRDDVTCPMK